MHVTPNCLRLPCIVLPHHQEFARCAAFLKTNRNYPYLALLLYIRKGIYSHILYSERRASPLHNPQMAMSCFNSWLRQKIQEIAYKPCLFSASVPHVISILLMSGQVLSEFFLENMYPTKSKSFWCPIYHWAFLFSSHWSHHLLLFVLVLVLL